LLVTPMRAPGIRACMPPMMITLRARYIRLRLAYAPSSASYFQQAAPRPHPLFQP
jgi:hypothetical protein